MCRADLQQKVLDEKRDHLREAPGVVGLERISDEWNAPIERLRTMVGALSDRPLVTNRWTPPTMSDSGGSTAMAAARTESFQHLLGWLLQIRAAAQGPQEHFAAVLATLVGRDASGRDAVLLRALDDGETLREQTEAHVAAALAEIKELFRSDAEDHAWCQDVVTKIEMRWRLLLSRWPSKGKPADETADALRVVVADLDDVVFQCATLTITPRLNDILENVRVDVLALLLGQDGAAVSPSRGIRAAPCLAFREDRHARNRVARHASKRRNPALKLGHDPRLPPARYASRYTAQRDSRVRLPGRQEICGRRARRRSDDAVALDVQSCAVMRNRFSSPRACFLVASLAAAVAGCSGGPSTTGELLASGGLMASGPLAVGSSSLFFVDGSTDGLSRIPIAGGAPSTLDPSPPAISFLAVDATSVFYGGSDDQAGAIRRVPQAGGAPETLVTSSGFMGGMTVSGGRLYWITEGVAASEVGDDPVVGAGTVFSMVIPSIGEAAPAATAIAEKLPFPCALASDDASLYWLDCTSNELLSLPLGASPGTKPATLATGLGLSANTLGGLGTVPFAVAGGHVYWTEINDGDAEPDGGTVFTVPTTGGAPGVVAVRNDWAPAQLMADATDVYWMTSSNYSGPSGDGPDVNDRDPGLWSAHAGGGSVSQVLGEDASPMAIAMDARFVYWADENDGSLRRTAR